MEKKIRLDKYLADMGIGTRSQVRQLCKEGAVTVNGEREKKSDRKVEPFTDSVSVNGQAVGYEKFAYYLLNKPAGVVTATMDNFSGTVMDCLAGVKERNLAPVGRLDKDTVGLLLITNDGELAHQLLAPGRHVPKTYFVKLDGPASEEDCKAMEAGISLSDGTECLPARCEILQSGDGCHVHLTIVEGKFHQVKRMWEARGRKVVYLQRISMGSLKLGDDLAEGEFRRLTQNEIDSLKGNQK